MFTHWPQCRRNIKKLQQGFELMNNEIRAGNSWPFSQPYKTLEAYSKYFHSHASFAVRFTDQVSDIDKVIKQTLTLYVCLSPFF